MTSTQTRLLLITLFAIGIRLAWGLTRYLIDPVSVDLGDYILYEEGAKHFLQYGDFSASLFLARPPLYALVIAALGVNQVASLVAGAIFGGLITPLVYWLGRAFGLNKRVSWLGALIYAVDFVAIAYGAALLDSIGLADLLITTMVLLLLLAMQAEQRRQSLLLGAAAGLALVLSVLTRPASYLIWTGLSVWLWLTFRHQWRALVAYVLVVVIGIGAWATHNQVVFGNRTLSTVSTFTLAFYRAASVERIGTGQDIDTVYLNIIQRVEKDLGNDPTGATLSTRWGYLTASPEVADALTSTSIDIFREYPLIWLATFPLGFVRMYSLVPYFMRTTTEFALLNIVVVWNWLLLLGAVGGLIISYRTRRWMFFWGAFLIAGYYTTGTLLVKNAGLVGRERAVLTPYMALAAALTIDWLWARWKTRRNDSGMAGTKGVPQKAR